MVASNHTVAELVRIVRRYVPEQNLLPFLESLEQVPGNKSFRDTVKLLISELLVAPKLKMTRK